MPSRIAACATLRNFAFSFILGGYQSVAAEFPLVAATVWQMADRYMTVKEAAVLLGRTPRHITGQINKGADGWFPGAFRDGRRAWRIPSGEVDRRMELRTEVRVLVSAERLLADYAAHPELIDEVTRYAFIVLARRVMELDGVLERRAGATWSAGHEP
jgi:hypothetical protein